MSYCRHAKQLILCLLSTTNAIEEIQEKRPELINRKDIVFHRDKTTLDDSEKIDRVRKF